MIEVIKILDMHKLVFFFKLRIHKSMKQHIMKHAVHPIATVPAAALAQSIEVQIFTLPESMVVWPGHGGPTTVGEEKRGNPFVNGSGSGLLQREAEG